MTRRINTALQVLAVLAATHEAIAAARVWTDSTGGYTLDADLVMFNDTSVVLQRADHELVAIPIASLSEADREYLKSDEASDANRLASEELQTWTLREGTKVTGRIVDYMDRNVTLQRRRGRIYVNDRVFDNLPDFYQRLIPAMVAYFENLRRSDRNALEAWLVRQRGQPRTFHIQGVVVESENGDEYPLPFFFFSEDDLSALKPGWTEWKKAQDGNEYETQEGRGFLLRSLAAARHRDQLVKRDIARLQLKLQAVQAGITSLWEVTLYPPAGQNRRPQWVVVPGRNSQQAIDAARLRNPGYIVGPVRRVAG